MDNVWNVALQKVEGNIIVGSDNNPSESGYYLCTCISMWRCKENRRYLNMMYYDAERNCWRDFKNQSGVSHNVLAWTDKIKPCEFTNYHYIAGGIFVESNKSEF